MANLVTLENFSASKDHYHIYRIRNSTIAHEPHYHNYFQVCFVARGEILHKQSHSELQLGPGDAFIIPPGFIHSIEFSSRYSEIYSLSFEERLLTNYQAQSGVRLFLNDLYAAPVRLRIMPDGKRQKHLQSLLDCLLQQKDLDCPEGFSAVPSLVCSVLNILAQSYYAQPSNAQQLENTRSYKSVMQQCIEYIDSHYAENLSLEELAKQAALSRSSFCTIFRQFTGMTFRNYIAQKRVSQAQLLIRSNTDMSISEIATSVGYWDDSTFYRNFLKMCGVSPSEYRRLCHRE